MFAKEYERCLGTVRGIQEPNTFLMLLHNGGETSASVLLVCMALEVKVRDYVEILTSYHKGYTGDKHAFMLCSKPPNFAAFIA